MCISVPSFMKVTIPLSILACLWPVLSKHWVDSVSKLVRSGDMARFLWLWRFLLLWYLFLSLRLWRRSVLLGWLWILLRYLLCSQFLGKSRFGTFSSDTVHGCFNKQWPYYQCQLWIFDPVQCHQFPNWTGTSVSTLHVTKLYTYHWTTQRGRIKGTDGHLSSKTNACRE